MTQSPYSLFGEADHTQSRQASAMKGLGKRIALARAHRRMLEHNLKRIEADLLKAKPAKLRERYDMHAKALRFAETRESWLASRQPEEPQDR